MSSFTKELRVKVLDNGAHYEVLDEFVYYRDSDGNIKIKVEEGFVTDFASVPRLFWSIFPPFGKYTKAAVLHDRLCVAFHNKETWSKLTTDLSTLPSEYHNKVVTRKEADEVFKEAMEAIKVNKVTRWFLYTSVRLFGIFAYGKKA